MGAITACRTALLGAMSSSVMIAAQRASLTTRAATVTVPSAKDWPGKWLADRQAELLLVPYFHVVFTPPAPLGEIAFETEAAVYAILFRAAAETFAIIAADPRHLGAELGMTMVLHTWGQTLQHSPHVHCVVPGGGPSLDGTRWVACALASSWGARPRGVRCAAGAEKCLRGRKPRFFTNC